MFRIAAQTVSFMLCCICCHASNDRAIIITAKDCEDLEDTSILCLKSFSIVSKSNRRSEKCSKISSVKSESSLKNRDLLMSLLECIICSNRRIASLKTDRSIIQLNDQIRDFLTD